MLKIYTGITPLKVKTDNLETIPSAVCDDLSVGDVVAVVNGEEDITYIVSQKFPRDSMTLVNTTYEQITSVYYSWGENGWEYTETQATELGKSGTKLYRHKINFTYSSESGNGACKNPPYYFISTNNNPVTIAGFDYYVADKICSLSDRFSILGGGIICSGGNITIYDYKGDTYEFNSVQHFEDSVTEI
jgi:hypothetical protein